MNELAAHDTPFLFAVNYKGTETIVLPLDELSEQECLYNFEGMGNLDTPLSPSRLAGLYPCAKGYSCWANAAGKPYLPGAIFLRAHP